MSANNVKVIEKNTGRKIDWRQSGSKLFFGDDDLSIRCDNRQRDWPVHTDICADEDGNLVIGVGVGRYYVAQVDIPPVQYEPVEPTLEHTEDTPAPKPLPLDMGEVVLTLWSLDDITPATTDTDKEED